MDKIQKRQRSTQITTAYHTRSLFYCDAVTKNTQSLLYYYLLSQVFYAYKQTAVIIYIYQKASPTISF